MKPMTAGLLAALALAPAWAAEKGAPAPDKPAAKAQQPDWFDPWTDFKSWSEQARKELSAGQNIPPERFDKLFGDGFFKKKDPFALMDQFQKHFEQLLQEQERTIFGRSWQGWYTDRLGLGAIKESVETADDKVTLTLVVPGLDAKSVQLDVNRDRVRLSYSAKSSREETDAQGRVTGRSESYARFDKIVPVPAQADPSRYRVDKEGDVIRVIFARGAGPGPTA